METRKQIREYYKAKRSAMPQELAKRLSAQISETILHWEAYRQAETVFFYYPLGNEVSLLPVIEHALLHGKLAAFPKVIGSSMEFYETTTLDELSEGCFHVMEPQTEGKQPANPAHALCFVPGTAFDLTGGRFGYGRGYYDRYFAGRNGQTLAGCAYECQIAEELPTDEWDKRMDYLVSEKGICRF